MELFNKNKKVAKDTPSEHTPREMQLICNSLPQDPEERQKVIEILKKKRDQILSQRSKK